ncbi:unnamed protein product [Dracunculus medinensis]|uniref:Activin_recp domain-containing protein n=1 Tax=Dracunculus medinensis TaxID=318479 RepID=A0A0N4U3F9_DRAME|nr:unnamed protein product [Dracunculus medinensis]
MFFLQLLLQIPVVTYCLICISEHKFYEEGKIRQINRSQCTSSTKFCVKVRYWDKDPLKKRGFSLGCDKIDCEDSDDLQDGWNLNGCRKNLDYGTDGEICCCRNDFCNQSTSYRLSFLIILASFMIIFIYLQIL